MEPKPHRSRLSQIGIRTKITCAIAPIAVTVMLMFAARAWTASAAKPQSAADVLQQLLDGNKLYVADKNVRPDERPSDASQEPKAVILACADSRVTPTIIFDQGIGSLFVVRTAGNTYDSLILDGIEYAVAHLHTRLIMVLGHDQCGAVKAAVEKYPKPTKSMMLRNIYPAVAKSKGMPGDAVSNAVSENAELVAERLAHEPEFAPLVASGELKIVAARYHLGNGDVTVLPDK